MRKKKKKRKEEGERKMKNNMLKVNEVEIQKNSHLRFVFLAQRLFEFDVAPQSDHVCGVPRIEKSASVMSYESSGCGKKNCEIQKVQKNSHLRFVFLAQRLFEFEVAPQSDHVCGVPRIEKSASMMSYESLGCKVDRRIVRIRSVRRFRKKKIQKTQKI